MHFSMQCFALLENIGHNSNKQNDNDRIWCYSSLFAQLTDSSETPSPSEIQTSGGETSNKQVVTESVLSVGKLAVM